MEWRTYSIALNRLFGTQLASTLDTKPSLKAISAPIHAESVRFEPVSERKLKPAWKRIFGVREPRAIARGLMK
jgi:hypothetical protein